MTAGHLRTHMSARLLCCSVLVLIGAESFDFPWARSAKTGPKPPPSSAGSGGLTFAGGIGKPPVPKLTAGSATAASGAIFAGDDSTITLGHRLACSLHVSEAAPRPTVGNSVVCWGPERHGRNITSPATHFAQVSAADGHVCGIAASELLCWGDLRGMPSTLAGGPFLAVATGENNVCGLRTNGSAVCGGRNNVGQSSPPVDVLFSQLSCGSDACCGIERGPGSALRCWGGSYADVTSPPSGPFVQVSVGSGGHACGIQLEGHVVCWGASSGPEGGNFSVAGSFLQVAVASGLTCAIRMDGTLTCFGDGASALYKSHGAPPRESRFMEIAVHGRDICGVTTEDPPRVVCFGPNGGSMVPPTGLKLPP